MNNQNKYPALYNTYTELYIYTYIWNFTQSYRKMKLLGNQ